MGIKQNWHVDFHYKLSNCKFPTLMVRKHLAKIEYIKFTLLFEWILLEACK